MIFRVLMDSSKAWARNVEKIHIFSILREMYVFFIFLLEREVEIVSIEWGITFKKVCNEKLDGGGYGAIIALHINTSTFSLLQSCYRR